MELPLIDIPAVDKSFAKLVQKDLDQKTKPIGSLGRLEELASKMASILSKRRFSINKPHLVVFAADHGLAEEAISAYPQQVTFEMVKNFASGGAAVNVLCRHVGMDSVFIDAGVKGDTGHLPYVQSYKVARGSQNSLKTKAMSKDQYLKCFESGQEIVAQVAETGCNLIGFGEMGIGNTSSSSLIAAQLLGLPVEQLVGRGTGVSDEGLSKKLEILKKVESKWSGEISSPHEAMICYGSFSN